MIILCFQLFAIFTFQYFDFLRLSWEWVKGKIRLLVGAFETILRKRFINVEMGLSRKGTFHYWQSSLTSRFCNYFWNLLFLWFQTKSCWQVFFFGKETHSHKNFLIVLHAFCLVVPIMSLFYECSLPVAINSLLFNVFENI